MLVTKCIWERGTNGATALGRGLNYDLWPKHLGLEVSAHDTTYFTALEEGHCVVYVQDMHLNISE